MKRNSILKTAALVTAVIFVTTTIAWSAPPVYTIKIPEKYGKVTERWKAPRENKQSVVNSTHVPTVVLIQDAHTSLEAQENIAGIIQELVQQTQKSEESKSRQTPSRLDGTTHIVCVEGAAGKLDLTPFRKFPIHEARDTIAYQYMKEGFFSGAEYASIISADDIQVVGAEDADLFRKNFTTYYHAAHMQDEILPLLEDIENVLQELKLIVYDDELLTFDSAYEAFLKDMQTISTFVPLLFEQVARDELSVSYPDLYLFQEILIMEAQFDYGEAQTERDDLFITVAHAKSTTQEERTIYSQWKMRWSKKEISEKEWCQYLCLSAEKKHIDISSYPQFKRYLAYLKKHQTINFQILIEDIKAVSRDILIRRAGSEDEKILVKMSDMLHLMRAIITLNATREETIRYVQYKNVFPLSSLVTNIELFSKKYAVPNTVAADVSSLEKVVGTCEAFFSDAEKRDTALIENTLHTINEENDTVGILVSGGYHTGGITNELRKKNIDYCVIAPAVSSFAESIPYADKMRGNLFPLTSALTSYITAVAQYVMSAEQREWFYRTFGRKSAAEAIILEEITSGVQANEQEILNGLEKLKNIDIRWEAIVAATHKSIETRFHGAEPTREALARILASEEFKADIKAAIEKFLSRPLKPYFEPDTSTWDIDAWRIEQIKAAQRKDGIFEAIVSAITERNMDEISISSVEVTLLNPGKKFKITYLVDITLTNGNTYKAVLKSYKALNRKRFDKEVGALKILTQGNIVELYGVWTHLPDTRVSLGQILLGEDNDYYLFFAQKYIKGWTLREYIRELSETHQNHPERFIHALKEALKSTIQRYASIEKKGIEEGKERRSFQLTNMNPDNIVFFAKPTGKLSARVVDTGGQISKIDKKLWLATIKKNLITPILFEFSYLDCFSNEELYENIGKVLGDEFLEDIISEKAFNRYKKKKNREDKFHNSTNVTCGTIGEKEHTMLNQELEERFIEFARVLDITRNIQEEPLSEAEADKGLTLLEGERLRFTEEQLRKLREDIREYIRKQMGEGEEELQDFKIFFNVPENWGNLFWVGPHYAGGHFNVEKRRIHISLPIALEEKINLYGRSIEGPQAAAAIALHDFKHLEGLGHDDDEGMKIVRYLGEKRKTALSEVYRPGTEKLYVKRVKDHTNFTADEFVKFINSMLVDEMKIADGSIFSHYVHDNIVFKYFDFYHLTGRDREIIKLFLYDYSGKPRAVHLWHAIRDAFMEISKKRHLKKIAASFKEASVEDIVTALFDELSLLPLDQGQYDAIIADVFKQAPYLSNKIPYVIKQKYEQIQVKRLPEEKESSAIVTDKEEEAVPWHYPIPREEQSTLLPANVTCGTINEKGHALLNREFEGRFTQFAETLKEKNLIARDRDIKQRPLNEDEADKGLVALKGKAHGFTEGELTDLRSHIRQNVDIPSDIQIFFNVPKKGNDLFWVNVDGQWQYAGGHFSTDGTRIHISLPIALKDIELDGKTIRGPDAAAAIARHDFMHCQVIRGERNAITEEEHEDEGMRVVHYYGRSGYKISSRISKTSGNIRRDYAKPRPLWQRIQNYYISVLILVQRFIKKITDFILSFISRLKPPSVYEEKFRRLERKQNIINMENTKCRPIAVYNDFVTTAINGYRGSADTQHEVFSLQRYLQEVIVRKEGEKTRYLDAGCGIGVALNQMKWLFKEAIEVYGVDIVDWETEKISARDYEAVRVHLERDPSYTGLSFMERNFTLIQKDIADEDLSDKKMDLITSFAVLQYHDNPLAAWCNLYNHLTPGGLFVSHLDIPLHDEALFVFYQNFVRKLRDVAGIAITLDSYEETDAGERHLIFIAHKKGNENLYARVPDQAMTKETVRVYKDADTFFDMNHVQYTSADIRIKDGDVSTGFKIYSRSPIRQNRNLKKHFVPQIPEDDLKTLIHDAEQVGESIRIRNEGDITSCENYKIRNALEVLRPSLNKYPDVQFVILTGRIDPRFDTSVVLDQGYIDAAGLKTIVFSLNVLREAQKFHDTTLIDDIIDHVVRDLSISSIEELKEMIESHSTEYVVRDVPSRFFTTILSSLDEIFPYVIKIPNMERSPHIREQLTFAKKYMGGIVAPFTVLEDVTIGDTVYPFVMVQKKMYVIDVEAVLPYRFTFSDGFTVNDLKRKQELLQTELVRRGIAYNDYFHSNNYGIDPYTKKLYLVDIGDPRFVNTPRNGRGFNMTVDNFNALQKARDKWVAEGEKDIPVPDVFGHADDIPYTRFKDIKDFWLSCLAVSHAEEIIRVNETLVSPETEDAFLNAQESIKKGEGKKLVLVCKKKEYEYFFSVAAGIMKKYKDYVEVTMLSDEDFRAYFSTLRGDSNRRMRTVILVPTEEEQAEIRDFYTLLLKPQSAKHFIVFMSALKVLVTMVNGDSFDPAKAFTSKFMDYTDFRITINNELIAKQITERLEAVVKERLLKTAA